MKNKLDCSIFDEEMERLKTAINSINASSGGDPKPIIPTGPTISSKEMADIREAIKKVWEHEEKCKNLSLDEILKKLQELEKSLKDKADKHDIKKLDDEKADKKKVKEKIKKLKKQIDELKDLLKKLDLELKALSALSGSSSQKSGINPDIIVSLT